VFVGGDQNAGESFVNVFELMDVIVIQHHVGQKGLQAFSKVFSVTLHSNIGAEFLNVQVILTIDAMGESGCRFSQGVAKYGYPGGNPVPATCDPL